MLDRAAAGQSSLVFIKKIKEQFFRKLGLQKKRRRGFTLLEIMIVLVILGGLMIIFLVNIDTDDTTQIDLHNKAANTAITTAIYQFERTCGRKPANEEGLAVLTKQGPAIEGCPQRNYLSNTNLMLDYYKTPYKYEIDENGEYRVLSLGADKKVGGEGKNADILINGSSAK